MASEDEGAPETTGLKPAEADGEDNRYSASEALAEVLTNEHFLKFVREVGSDIRATIEKVAAERTAREQVVSAERVQRERDLRANWRWVALAHYAMATVVFVVMGQLLAAKSVNETAGTSILVAVVASLFVQQKKGSE